MRILVVDDDEGMREIIGRNMRDIAHDVCAVGSFSEAMEIMTAVPPPPIPDLILLDLNLLDSGAERTISRIHEIRDANEQSVIIVLSGVVDESYNDRIIEAGADGFFTKDDMMPMRSKARGFMDNFGDAVAALIKRPTRYQKNIKILEMLSERLAKGARRSF